MLYTCTIFREKGFQSYRAVTIPYYLISKGHNSVKSEGVMVLALCILLDDTVYFL